ncbi:hypothetical protein [Streptomyces albidochromogenes]|uniref:Uncharacterized protein n=1 Tax=Streptomyces albidochromogenes TaxID=329524 RepID=A0ABW6FKM2_9ACTN
MSNAAYDHDATVHHAAATAFVWTRRDDGAGPELYGIEGHCPACHCPMAVSWPVGQYAVAKGGLLGRRAKPVTDRPWYTSCRCRSAHHGRPPGEDGGCGAGIYVPLPANGLPE